MRICDQNWKDGIVFGWQISKQLLKLKSQQTKAFMLNDPPEKTIEALKFAASDFSAVSENYQRYEKYIPLVLVNLKELLLIYGLDH